MAHVEEWRPIGALAQETGVKVATIRFYEQIGLMPEARRTEGAWRLYGDPASKRLSFIKHARELGFGVEDIRALLELSDAPERPCADADRIAQAQLAVVERKIAQLEGLREELSRMVHICAGGRSAGECWVIEALGERTLCGGAHTGAEGLDR